MRVCKVCLELFEPFSQHVELCDDCFKAHASPKYPSATRVEHIGDATLILGDCREVLPTLPRVDACVTDPPYGIGIAANPVRQKHDKLTWDNLRPGPDIFKMIRAISDHQIIWGGNYFDLPATQRFLIWDKVQPEDFSLAMCEQAWTNLKGPAKLFRRHVVSYEKLHPTQKPVEVMEWCLGYVPDAQVILDPFMGVATTGVACVNRGRRFIGVEVHEPYFDIACRRITEAYRQPRLFAEPAPKPKQEGLAL